MNLGAFKRKIGELLAARAAIAARPMVDVYLPDNGRGPGGPLSDVQVVQATPTTRVISYPPGSPPLELAASQAGASGEDGARL
jgi:hypothetical protein